jgi:hypothetical protein
VKAPSGPYADKLWREALRKAVLERVEGEQKLDRIAKRVVDQALDGDDKAYREIGDRLDGKATQHNEHSGPGGSAIPVQFIELIAVKPDAAAD